MLTFQIFFKRTHSSTKENLFSTVLRAWLPNFGNASRSRMHRSIVSARLDCIHGREEESVSPVFDDLHDPACPASNNRSGPCHALDKYHAEGLLASGKRHDVGCRVKRA